MDFKTMSLLKGYVADTAEGYGAVIGKSAYEVAVAAGFKGSERQWLESLQGISPHIGDNGNWFVGDYDTKVAAEPSVLGYATETYVDEKINKIQALTESEILAICK